MIPVEKLRAVKHVVTHDKCPDGTASAMILKDVLPEAKVTFVAHNTKLHLEMPVEEGMLFCDFVPPESRAEEFAEAGTICLDHHKHAKNIVEKFGNLGVFADEKKNPGVSGALLAFQEVWVPLTRADNDEDNDEACERAGLIEDFATLTGVRDTWQRKDPRWDEACAQAEALTFWPEDTLLGTAPSTWQERLELGSFLYQRRLKSAKRAADNGYSFTTRRGTNVVVFEGTRQSSDAADYLDDEVDIVIGFGTFIEHGEPVVIFSTRSHTGYDVGKMCKSLGGGGHTAAAGFTYKMNAQGRPLSWLERTFFQYLYRLPTDFYAVRQGHLHPFFLAEKIVRKYEGE